MLHPLTLIIIGPPNGIFSYITIEEFFNIPSELRRFFIEESHNIYEIFYVAPNNILLKFCR